MTAVGVTTEVVDAAVVAARVVDVARAVVVVEPEVKPVELTAVVAMLAAVEARGTTTGSRETPGRKFSLYFLIEIKLFNFNPRLSVA